MQRILKHFGLQNRKSAGSNNNAVPNHSLIHNASDYKQRNNNISNNNPSRRNFRGNRKLVTIDTSLVYSWVDEFQSRMARSPATCSSMIEQYEADVHKYGYSLRELHRVTPTRHLSDYYMPDDRWNPWSLSWRRSGGTCFKNYAAVARLVDRNN